VGVQLFGHLGPDSTSSAVLSGLWEAVHRADWCVVLHHNRGSDVFIDVRDAADGNEEEIAAEEFERIGSKRVLREHIHCGMTST